MSVLKLKDNQGNITPILTIKGEKGDPYCAIGQIVESVLPLTDAGLHLLDGAKLPATGMYAAFYQHCQSIQASHPSLFVSESDWQSTFSTYGSCGKFVIDSDGVRLPSISNIVQGTSDVAQLGELVEAGLPNITGMFTAASSSATLAFQSEGYVSSKTAKADWGERTWHNVSFDASRSSSIYGNSETVQPQTIKVLLYICVANNTKSDVVVDIDRVATDLNGKLDRDLSNVVGNAVERVSSLGSNSNGQYIRFESGLQICMGYQGWEADVGALGYINFNWTFPVPFANKAETEWANCRVFINPRHDRFNANCTSFSTTSAHIAVCNTDSRSQYNPLGFDMIAIGYWKEW